MKRIVSLFLACVLVFSGCAQIQEVSTDMIVTEQEENQNESMTSPNDTSKSELQNGEISSIDVEEADTDSHEYVVEFDTLNDNDLMRYVEDNIYARLVEELDSDEYFVENVRATYVSQEYIDELTFNSQSNVYFGYTLAELDEMFQGTRYVFTLGDDGDTIVTAFEAYDDTYEKVIKNVAIGTGVILICVTVSIVSEGFGAPAVSMIFAASAKTGTIFAVSSGILSSIAAGVTTGIQTKDMEQAIKAAALAGSENFKWNAIIGVAQGGASEFGILKGATLNGLTMNQAAAIQKESKYPVEVIKQFHTIEEYEVFKTANLESHIINGKTALIRSDIDLNIVDENGYTNLQRMELGKAPLDANVKSYELHHIGQAADATLAILTCAEHDNKILHGFKAISEIDRSDFDTTRKEFWKTMANVLELMSYCGWNDRDVVIQKNLLQYETILTAMEPGEWYQVSEFSDILGVKESRTKELLRELVVAGLLEDDGATKGKKYRKPENKPSA